MIRLTQTFLNDESSLRKQEASVHKDADELLPSAKGRTFMDIAAGRPCLLLSVQITGEGSDDSATVEKDLISSTDSMRFMAFTNRALNEACSRNSDLSVLSISFLKEFSKTRSDGLTIKILMYNVTEEELDEGVLDEIESLIKGELENNKRGVKVIGRDRDALSKPYSSDIEESNAPVNKEVIAREMPVTVKEPEVPEVKTVAPESKSPAEEDIPFNMEETPVEEDAEIEIGFTDLTPDEPTDDEPIAASAKPSVTTADDDDFIGEGFFDFGQDFFGSKESAAKKQPIQETLIPKADIKAVNKASVNAAPAKEAPVEPAKTIESVVSQKPAEYEKNDKKNDNNARELGKFSQNISEGENAPNNSPANNNYKGETVNEEKSLQTEKKNTNFKKENRVEEKKNVRKGVLEVPFLNRVNDDVVNIFYDFEENSTIRLFDEDYNLKTTFSKENLDKIYNEIINYYNTNEKNYTRKAVARNVSEQDFIDNVRAHIEKYHKVPVEDVDYLLKKVKNAFYSYHVLIPAINDRDVSDIRISDPSIINVRIKGKHYIAEDMKFINKKDYFIFIQNLLIRSKSVVNSPIISVTDDEFCESDILRINITLPDINTSKMPTLHIRKVPKEKIGLKELVDDDMLPKKVAKYLLDKVKTSSIVVGGPSASRKTTLLNALIDYIPRQDSIHIIQESDELFSKVHPNVFSQHILKNNLGEVSIGLSAIGRNGLTCDSQYFIDGEVKDVDARDLLNACFTGHKCWCTTHAGSLKDIIPRLVSCAIPGSSYTFKEMERMFKDFNVLVYVESGKVIEIAEIVGYDEDKGELVYKTVYKYGI